MWTKSLDAVSDSAFDHGVVFALCMLSCFIGASAVTIVRLRGDGHSGNNNGSQLKFVCVMSAVSLGLVVFVTDFTVRLFLFVIYEICVGFYRPTIGSLRSKLIPHQHMARIINFFRLPLNFIVVAVLFNIETLGERVYIIAALLLVVSSFIASKLAK